MGRQKYQVCDCCGKELPKNINYFKKYSHKTAEGLNFHTTCRDCELKQKYDEEWKDGKLKCHICNQYFDPNIFHIAGGSKYNIRDNRDTRCPNCKIQQNKLARSNYTNDTKLNKVLQARWFGAKDRASLKNIPFTITKEDLLSIWEKQQGLCAISKIPMTYELDSWRVFSNVSIDQKIPGKGYTIDNVQLVCMAVNQLKSDFEMDTILYICKQIVNNYQK